MLQCNSCSDGQYLLNHQYQMGELSTKGVEDIANRAILSMAVKNALAKSRAQDGQFLSKDMITYFQQTFKLAKAIYRSGLKALITVHVVNIAKLNRIVVTNQKFAWMQQVNKAAINVNTAMDYLKTSRLALKLVICTFKMDINTSKIIQDKIIACLDSYVDSDSGSCTTNCGIGRYGKVTFSKKGVIQTSICDTGSSLPKKTYGKCLLKSGSMQAEIFAYEIGAPFQNAEITIKLFPGKTHQIERFDSNIYLPRYYDQISNSIKITIDSLDGQTVKVLHKMRDQFKMLVGGGLTIRNIEFDATDSIIDSQLLISPSQLLSSEFQCLLNNKINCCNIQFNEDSPIIIGQSYCQFQEFSNFYYDFTSLIEIETSLIHFETDQDIDITMTDCYFDNNLLYKNISTDGQNDLVQIGKIIHSKGSGKLNILLQQLIWTIDLMDLKTYKSNSIIYYNKNNSRLNLTDFQIEFLSSNDISLIVLDLIQFLAFDNVTIIKIQTQRNGQLIKTRAKDSIVYLRNSNFNCQDELDQVSIIDGLDVLDSYSLIDSVGQIEINGYNNSFKNCYASESGGVFSLQDGTNLIDQFSNYTSISSQQGGVVYCINCSMNMSYCLFENIVTINGGVVYVEGISTFFMENSLLLNLFAKQSGSMIYMINLIKSEATNTQAMINNCTIQKAQSMFDGGLLYLDSFGVQIIIQDSTFSDIQSNQGNGGIFYVNEATLLSIQNTSFQNYEAHKNGAILYSESQRIMISISSSNFTQNQNDYETSVDDMDSALYEFNSGAIYIKNALQVIFRNNIFRNHFRPFQGGVMYLESTTFQDKDSIYNNSYAYFGGAMYFYSMNSITLDSVIFEKNHAFSDGGSIFIDEQNGNLSFNNITITRSTSNIWGGAIIFQSYSNQEEKSFEIIGGKFSFIQSYSSGLMFFTDYNAQLIIKDAYIQDIYTRQAFAISVLGARNVYISNLDINNIFLFGSIKQSFLGALEITENIYITSSIFNCVNNNLTYKAQQATIIADEIFFNQNQQLPGPFIIAQYFPQAMINNLTVRNCQIVNFIQKSVITMDVGVNLFIDINSTYENIQNPYPSVYQINYAKAYLYNNTYINLSSQQYGMLYSYQSFIFIQGIYAKNVSCLSVKSNCGVLQFLMNRQSPNRIQTYRKYTVRNSTFIDIKSNSQGSFLYFDDARAKSLEFQSITIINPTLSVQEDQSTYQSNLMYLIRYPTGLQIQFNSLKGYQQTTISGMRTNGDILLFLNQPNMNVYFNDTIFDCQGQSSNEQSQNNVLFMIGIQPTSTLYTKNCIFKNCQYSNLQTLININSGLYQDDGSIFINSSLKNGTIAQTNGLGNLTLKNSKIINCSSQTIDVGLIYHSSFGSVLLENAQFQEIITRSNGGIITTTLTSDQPLNSSITIKNCYFLNIQSNQGGLIYSSNQRAIIKIQNTQVKNIFGIFSSSIIHIQKAVQVEILDSHFQNFHAPQAGLLFSEYSAFTLIIKRSEFDNKLGLTFEELKSKFQLYRQDDDLLSAQNYFTFKNGIACILEQNIFRYLGMSRNGGVFLLENTLLTDYDSTFEYNMAQQGSAIYLATAKADLKATKFENNIANIGGSIYAVANSIINLNDCLFRNNHAFESAGVIYISSQSVLHTKNTLFTKNNAPESSVIQVLSSPSDQNITIQSSEFSYNNASSNTMSFMFAQVWIEGSEFLMNDAKFKTRNIMCGYSNVTIKDSQFQHQNSKYSFNDMTTGSFIFLSFEVFIDIIRTQFKNGISLEGGAIYILGNIYVNIQSSKFINNLALSNGGAVYSSGFQDIYIGNKTLFQDNQALESGEDIYISNSFNKIRIDQVTINKINSKNSILIENAILEASNILITDTNSESQTSQGNGAGIKCQNCRGLSIMNSKFQNLRSQQGGCLYITESESNKESNSINLSHKYKIENTTFSNCSALLGGAIFANNPQSLIITSSIFQSNKAYLNAKSKLEYQGSGGAIFYTCNSDTLNCQLQFAGTNNFKSNQARIQGGAIFWDQLEPVFNQNNLVFSQNQATQYGNDIGSYSQDLISVSYQQYALHMQKLGYQIESRMLNNQSDLGKITSNQIENQRSGGEIKTLYLSMQDKYGQIVGSDFSSKVKASVQTLNLDSNQSKYPPLIEGSYNFDTFGGISVIQNMKFVGNPGSNYTLVFSTNGIDEKKFSNLQAMKLRNTSDLNLKLSINLQLCEIGDQFTTAGKCELCKGGYSLQRMTEPGTCDICPIEKAICLGGSNIGPLPGFWRKSNQSKNFITCPNYAACLGMVPPQNNPIGSCASGYQGILCSICEEGFSRDGESICSKCPDPILNSIRLLVIFLVVILLVILMIRSTLVGAQDKNNITNIFQKNVLNHFQLLLMTGTFDFQWSSNILGFFSQTNKVATAYTQIFSFDCFLKERIITNNSTGIYQTYQQDLRIFYQKLILIAILPFVLTISCYLIWKIIQRIRKDIQQVNDKIVASLVIVLFLAHPSLVTQSFSIFQCKDIDDESRLRLDLEIQCWDKQHSLFSYFIALPTIILWGLGIPFFGLAILIKERKSLDQIQTRQKYGFLYRGYRIDFYYWEIVIMYRKILIIFIAVFVSSLGVVAQALVMFFVLISYHSLNDLESLSLVTSIITIFCGVFFILNRPQAWISQNPDYSVGYLHLSTASQNILFAVIIISNAFFFIYWTFKMYQELRAKIRERFTRLYLFFCLCQKTSKLEKELKDHEIMREHNELAIEMDKLFKHYKQQFKSGQLQLTKQNIEKLIIVFSLDNLKKIACEDELNQDQIQAKNSNRSQHVTKRQKFSRSKMFSAEEKNERWGSQDLDDDNDFQSQRLDSRNINSTKQITFQTQEKLIEDLQEDIGFSDSKRELRLKHINKNQKLQKAATKISETSLKTDSEYQQSSVIISSVQRSDSNTFHTSRVWPSSTIGRQQLQSQQNGSIKNTSDTKELDFRKKNTQSDWESQESKFRVGKTFNSERKYEKQMSQNNRQGNVNELSDSLQSNDLISRKKSLFSKTNPTSDLSLGKTIRDLRHIQEEQQQLDQIVEEFKNNSGKGIYIQQIQVRKSIKKQLTKRSYRRQIDNQEAQVKTKFKEAQSNKSSQRQTKNKDSLIFLEEFENDESSNDIRLNSNASQQSINKQDQEVIQTKEEQDQNNYQELQNSYIAQSQQYDSAINDMTQDLDDTFQPLKLLKDSHVQIIDEDDDYKQQNISQDQLDGILDLSEDDIPNADSNQDFERQQAWTDTSDKKEVLVKFEDSIRKIIEEDIIIQEDEI
ncbi:UNKNOWN [Stylonychia lemnae]|uniref:DUF7630 domain-containing protein n=1 Tax=Stylonychia lemnae TaxID=5949 RepID=A0A077ZZG0_STYLE|nr:UNKNOWN [Stylonychia lemnae]|eukprot:CDW74982.1 UNKNOWN [Stylonychia lemnae]